MKRVSGPWETLPGEVYDLHWSKYRDGRSFGDHMADVSEFVTERIHDAYKRGVDYVSFTHGYSTSGPFKTSSRSIVRAIIRSKDTTPYILRSECVQHTSYMIVRIRPNPSVSGAEGSA